MKLVGAVEVVRTTRAGTALRTVLRALAAGPVAISELTDTLRTRDGKGDDSENDEIQFASLLKRHAHLFAWSVACDAAPLVTVEPISRWSRFDLQLPDDTLPLRLSRFAYARRQGDQLVVESPLSLFRVRLQSPLAREVVSALGEVTSVTRLAAGQASGPGFEAVRMVVGHLVAAKVVDVGTKSGVGAGGEVGEHKARFAEDGDDVLRQWAFHDLLFHARSRFGRHDEPFGATFSFIGDIEHEPPVKQRPVGPTTPLYRPDLDDILAHDPRFTAVMESRQSIRAYDEQPMTARQLGEFLYRVQRVRAIYGPDELSGVPYQGVDRPYPTGGATGDLDVYVTVNRCADLPRGVYYYDSAAHQLVLIDKEEKALQTMLGMAYRACAGAVVPDVLLTITARFQRMAWKYSNIAYASTLKHVGVLYQTLYLVATAMQLAPCGLGSGDIQTSADIFGLDWRRESSVGECMLGSRPAEYGSRGARRVEFAGWQHMNDPQWATEALRDV
ncbi:SagB family peptide dehydrogenase [Streptomyces coffeae]|uniref:SagB family peptide dehydrogenase n=1 Tax=Streptomyces coffeae TaxID=621382 RepID=A0ABS1NCJ1_9ACTN|nr:SagB family peptide dehydrogenase [Streptomyces coffeae]MBL1097778.1 SagB family peptide dehydrogenase [Streptomyces coffeae]